MSICLRDIMPKPPFEIGRQMEFQDFQCLLFPYEDDPQKKLANELSNEWWIPECKGAVDRVYIGIEVSTCLIKISLAPWDSRLDFQPEILFLMVWIMPAKWTFFLWPKTNGNPRYLIGKNCLVNPVILEILLTRQSFDLGCNRNPLWEVLINCPEACS